MKIKRNLYILACFHIIWKKILSMSIMITSIPLLKEKSWNSFILHVACFHNNFTGSNICYKKTNKKVFFPIILIRNTELRLYMGLCFYKLQSNILHEYLLRKLTISFHIICSRNFLEIPNSIFTHS